MTFIRIHTTGEVGMDTLEGSTIDVSKGVMSLRKTMCLFMIFGILEKTLGENSKKVMVNCNDIE